jgi:hypothetical protein
VDAGSPARLLERGYVMDPPTLWCLAAGWYAGRLDAATRAASFAAAADSSAGSA